MKEQTLLLFLIFFFTCFSAFSCQKYYENPLIPGDYPDPGAIYLPDVGKWYVATTTDNNSLPNKFPIHSSENKVNWTFEGYIFPEDHLPEWAEKDFWAPEFHIFNGSFHVYYAARTWNGTLSVGVAVGYDILGPYVDLGTPLIYNASMGSIDPTVTYDYVTGERYLFWKDDGNAIGESTPIWATLLSPNGLSIDEQNRTLIISNDPTSWEGPLVEGPWVIYHDDIYTLFYSANGYLTTSYAIGVAQAKHLLGPWEKFEGNPILHSNEKWSGPGHCSVLNDPTNDNKTIMFYHSWYEQDIGGDYGRDLLMDEVYWDDNGWPYIQTDSPSTSLTPTP